MAGTGALAADLMARTLLRVSAVSLNTLPSTVGATLAGAPARQYVASGVPVHDCAQLVVWMPTISEAPARPEEIGELGIGERGRTGRINFTSFMVQVIRCFIDDGKGGIVLDTPSVEQLDEAGRQGNTDAWVLWCGINAARRAGAFDGVCNAVAFGNAQAINPSGGVYGWQVPVEVQLEGYKVDLGV